VKILNTSQKIEPYKKGINEILLQFEKENLDWRNTRLRQWKQQDLYWHNIQYVFWADDVSQFANLPDDDEEILTRVVNIYRAHGESIIAALAAGIPTVRFFPGDAENTVDIDTANAWSKTFDIAKKRNRMSLLFVKMLWILFNQDFVAIWNQTEKTKKYGTVRKDVYRIESEKSNVYSCPQCGAEVAQDTVDCPECGQQIIPLATPTVTNKQVWDKYDEIPRVNQKWNAFGPLNVNIPHWTAEPEDIPILILLQDKHFSTIKSENPNFRELIRKGSGENQQERWARAHFYNSSTYQNLLTEKRVWIRPSAYETLNDDERKRFEKDFPDGLCATVIEKDLVTQIYAESLLDVWTISRSPLSRTVHASSLGKPLLDIQDITNDLKNLKLQTVEHGISETFVDPEIVDFELYGKTAGRPGQLIPAKIPPGGNLGEYFFTNKPATLSKEANEFSHELVTDGQFVTGATPSIYGGNLQGSRTVGEYDRSRTQALQRLSIHYSMLKELIVELGEKTVKQFITDLKENEQDLQDVEFKNGVFSNNYILLTQLLGKVGKVEGEASEAFPVSWQQKAAGMMELFKLGNETINEGILNVPENTYFLKNVFGVPEIQIPGEQERNKQWKEIQQLVQEQPIPTEAGERSSIPVGEFDRHEIEFEICLTFLNSDRGMLLKEININGYKNVIAHAKEHQMFMAMKQETENAGRQPANAE
jgi:DNA-directed RNA polymerase subunit RPC12/RpoP